MTMGCCPVGLDSAMEYICAAKRKNVRKSHALKGSSQDFIGILWAFFCCFEPLMIQVSRYPVRSSIGKIKGRSQEHGQPLLGSGSEIPVERPVDMEWRREIGARGLCLTV
jgi:hypothetical protein